MGLKDFTNSKLGTVVVLAVTTGLILGGLWLVKGRGDGLSQVTLPANAAQRPPAVGEAATTFSAVDTNGVEVDLAQLRGQPVWLVFGATWCSNCRAEAADIEAVQQKLGDQVAIVAIYIGEDGPTVQDYAQRVGLTFTQLPDPDKRLAAAYRVMGFPAHYFVDKNGQVAQVKVGAISQKTASDLLGQLLG